MITQKKLVLTFLDDNGHKKKTSLNHFVNDIDHKVLAEHLATMPGNYYAENSKRNVAKLTHCIHASYAITNKYVLFNSHK